MHLAFEKTLVRTLTLTLCGMFLLGISQFAEANTLCVDPSGSHGCYSKIQDAVNHAAANDVINVGAGTYNEEVDIGIPLSLMGAGANKTFIDATNQSHSVFVDGYDHPGLNDVTVSNFTVENALYEGVLVVNASDVTISDNTIVNNDQIPHQFTGDLTGCTNQPGNGIYETDETGDCGGAIHLVGTINSVVSGNLITGNADGILISDETAESRNNLFIRNTVKDNPQECGIVLASHPNAGNTTPPFAPHFGVDHNTVSENFSTGNGVQVGGSGAGMF